MNNTHLPVAIIGAGPIGLAAVAHLQAAGRRFVLLEAGDSVGANIRAWGHVRLFSPWRYSLDKASEKLLVAHGVAIPNKDALPTGKELVDEYLVPLASLPSIRRHLHLNTRVTAVGRKGLDKVKSAGREELPFRVQVEENGQFRVYEAKAVIDASGTWGSPNPLGAGGIFAVGEKENQDRINYAIPDILGNDKNRYANKSVLVVGSGHSAMNSILDLAQVARHHGQTHIHWILRRKDVSTIFGGKDLDALEARGALGTRVEKLVKSGLVTVHAPVFVHQVRRDGDALTILGDREDRPFTLPGIEEIIANTGARPDFTFLREIRFDADAALESVPMLADLIDPNIHSCGTVRPHGELELRQREEGFYIVGVKSYGRAPTFLLATGYEQVRSVVAHLNGDEEAARRVELDLPETGVCSSGISANAAVSSCSTPDLAGASCQHGESGTLSTCGTAACSM